MILGVLRRAVAEGPCDAVLASGGVDSTAVALAHVELGLRPLLLSVQFLEAPGADLSYVQRVAARLGLPLVLKFFGRRSAVAAAEAVVRVLKVFNPMEVVNCAAVYLALREAEARGARRVCTGDGGDELCVGYSYMLEMPLEELREYVAKLPRRWFFCSFVVGRALGVEVSAPFVDVADTLLGLPLEEKVKCGVGKCMLRAELAEKVGRDVAWRRKTPVEAGTGFSALYHILAEAGRGLPADIPVEGAARYLYHVYRKAGYTYPRGERNPCPICGHELVDGYCPMCGYYAKIRRNETP